MPNLEEYSRVIVAFSGGKDSLACLLHLLDLGVPKTKIELWHHDVDGREGSDLMDWPCTRGYCEAVAKAFGIKLYFSWKQYGFEGEMLRANTPTAPTVFETPDGIMMAGGKSNKPGTRLKFPQVSADLSVRWCSAYLKIAVADCAIRNQERFRHTKTLVLTGERAGESTARAKYAPFENHRSDARDGKLRRHVDHWRPVLYWDEQAVWDIIERYKVQPHPAYRLGWGRVSCRACIFGSPNQWASLLAIAPETFWEISTYEEEFNTTIHRTQSVIRRAIKGTVYPQCYDANLVAEASDRQWDYPVFVEDWVLPAGAFGENAGPT